MADILSIILLVAGIILLFLAIIKSFGNKSTLVGIVGLVVLIFGGLGYMGAIDFSALGGGVAAPAFQSSQISAPQQSASSSACSPNAITSNGKSQADVLARNIENTTGLGYLTGTVSANSNGAFIDSATSNAGGSGTSYVSMSSIPNCGKGELVGTVTTGTGFASSRQLYDVEKGTLVAGYDFSDKSVHKYELRTASSAVLNILARDNGNNPASNGQINGSVLDGAGAASGENPAFVGGTGTADRTAYFKNTSVGAQGSVNFYIDMQVNESASVFGAYGEPDTLLISYDSGTASKFSDNSLSLSVYESPDSGWALNKLSKCPDDVKSNRNVEACWSAPTPKVGGLYRIRGTVRADGGDPIASDTKPSIAFDDRVFFRDLDGNIKYGAFSSSGGTNQGVGGTILQFVMS